MISGRKKEIVSLNKLYESNNAEFLAIYGRRRIGKTFLIKEIFKNKDFYFEITGQNKAKKSEQLRAFFLEFKSLFSDAEYKKPPKDWFEAFEWLKALLEKRNNNTKAVIFLDELPWLASSKSSFLEALDYFWNRHFSRLNVLLIICGSAASWMIKKVINDKGGLHGRLSAIMPLKAFTIEETERFLLDKNIYLKRKQIIELYLSIGGVAKYLTQVSSGKSPSQVINSICFSNQGMLFAEFTKLYASLFSNPEKHIALVKVLAKKKTGLLESDLLKEAKISQGGSSTEILNELEESGFIMRIPALGKKTKEHLFRLLDEYSLFYLTWIEPIKGNLFQEFDSNYWNKMHKKPLWYNWAGFAFENVCLKHTNKIKEALGISGVITHEGHFFYKPKTVANDKGTQIDLVIDRADDCINICEIKFCDDVFEISESYAEILEQKKQVFQKVTQTRKTIFLTLITPFGIKENKHSAGLVDSSLDLECLF